MVHARSLSAFCGLFVSCLLAVPGARAVQFTDSGKFTTDNDLLQISFTNPTTQTYNFFTTSYSGGANADGSTSMAGGFDPVLSLFNGDGTLFNGTGTAVSNGGSDANLTDVLNPGNYILVLIEFANFSNDGTLMGFTTDNAALISASCPLAPAGPFTDAVTCNQLNGNYTVNAVPGSVTPEPPSALLFLLPLGGAVYLSRRQLAATSAF